MIETAFALVLTLIGDHSEVAILQTHKNWDDCLAHHKTLVELPVPLGTELKCFEIVDQEI